MDARFHLQRVVIQTDSQYCFVGTLAEVTDAWLTLKNVVTIDNDERRLSLEEVLVECRQEHHRPSRRQLLIPRPRLISISLLDDVLEE
jgi:hypothetical protein